MSIRLYFLVFLSILKQIFNVELQTLEIAGIEPIGGPASGETRVTVRFKKFDRSIIDDYDRPKCRFGSNHKIVNATYIECTPSPRGVGMPEPTKAEKNETCIICELSPEHEVDIVPFSISLLGDFTDVQNSVPFRYYENPVIDWIYPRYGPKDGGTFVEVHGKNFLNFDQNLRCAFGSREVSAFYVSNEYMICYSPKSNVVEAELPFSVSLNNQQNTVQKLQYVYYEFPQVFRLEPNRGPDTGGTIVHIRGQNFDPTKDIELHNYNDTFCKFGNLSLTNAKVISSTEMICESPPSYEEREVPVEITLNNREWTRDGVLFYYYHPPFIYSIEPRIGPVSGNTTVNIIGSNFKDTGYVMCRFGGIYVKGEYISENELKCISPPVEKPGYVNLYVAIRKEEFSSGTNTKFLYYDDPEIEGISPICGPEWMPSPISIHGKNFANTGSDFVKCVFNRTVYTNATVLSDDHIHCDSPIVTNYLGINEKNITEYDVEITLNGIDIQGPKKKFYYYKPTLIYSTEPNFGPIEGNTTINVTGYNFNQPEVCNITFRIGTIQIKPIEKSNEWMIFKTPAVNYTGSTVIQVALNGRAFEKDIEVHVRNIQNTFNYIDYPLITDMQPKKGPTIGHTSIILSGIDISNTIVNQYFSSDILDIYYKFVDVDTGEVYGEPQKASLIDSFNLEILSPPVVRNDTRCNIYISYNGENYSNINEKLIFIYYTLPNIIKISPGYGPLKTENSQIELTLDNLILVGEDVQNLYCKFKSHDRTYIQKGEYIMANKVNCTAPNVNVPSTYDVEISMDGDDFTNNGLKFTYYDPYVLKVVPPMVSSRGGTKIKVYGYGFANSGENLKVQFGSSEERLRCGMKGCIVNAEFISEDLIEATTFPQNEVSYLKSGDNIGFNKFSVEASVYNNDFTTNNITIFYFDEPEIIQDIFTSTLPLNSTEKEAIANSLVYTMPANMKSTVKIPIDSSKINKYFKQFNEYANYTCKYTLEVEPYASKVTPAIVSSYPEDSGLNNIYLCKSPEWEYVGKSNVTISINGYDYSETKFDMIFTEVFKIHKLVPPCGPRRGGTKMKITGTGFETYARFGLKFGVENIVLMNTSKIIEDYNPDVKPELRNLEGIQNHKYQVIEIPSPEIPERDLSLGGPTYISYVMHNEYPLSSGTKYPQESIINTNFEFYYYHQPYLQSFSPHGSIVTGGTTVLLVGAYFDYRPEYEVRPYCKFGNKIVIGELLSTVRIICVAPPYDESNVRVPLEVSLNGIDFTDAGMLFTYYNDYSKAVFNSYEPTSGPDSGGTNIKLFGQSLTSLLNPDEFLCKFSPHNPNIPPKRVPAGFKEFPNNRTAVICNTPGGWSSGTVADIEITFDGQNFINTGFDFYFYKIDYLLPASGPTQGNGPIQVIGSGFQNSTKVKCKLNNIEYKPIDIYHDKILCPMPKCTFGLNFTGSVDFSVTLNGIDWRDFLSGFYYYVQPNITDIFPQYGPSKGNSLVKIFGSNFRNDFPGSNVGCKIGNNYGRGRVINDGQIECNVKSMPLLVSNNTMNFSIGLNNYSFIQETSNFNFTPYGISVISPSSGPFEGNTRIEVKGSGFFESENIKCRFGVPGWYGYTTGQFIDSNRIYCNSPQEFTLPAGAQLPFSVPFSIAFNDDEFSKFFI